MCLSYWIGQPIAGIPAAYCTLNTLSGETSRRGERRCQISLCFPVSLQTKCFICGIGSDYFDTTPHGFETHTFDEHNLANYMSVHLSLLTDYDRLYVQSTCGKTTDWFCCVSCRFFLMYLINKDETEHTGQVGPPHFTLASDIAL